MGMPWGLGFHLTASYSINFLGCRRRAAVRRCLRRKDGELALMEMMGDVMEPLDMVSWLVQHGGWSGDAGYLG